MADFACLWFTFQKFLRNDLFFYYNKPFPPLLFPDAPFTWALLGFDQDDFDFVGERRWSAGGQCYLLDTQVIDEFAVTVEVDGDWHAVEWIGELDGAACGAGIAGSQCVTIL